MISLPLTSDPANLVTSSSTINRKIVRVFVGGKTGVQESAFLQACSNFNFPRRPTTTYEFEYIYVDDVKKRHWGPLELIDWLLACDAHFFLSHPHQGKILQCKPNGLGNEHSSATVTETDGPPWLSNRRLSHVSNLYAR